VVVTTIEGGTLKQCSEFWGGRKLLEEEDPVDIEGYTYWYRDRFWYQSAQVLELIYETGKNIVS